MPLITIAQTVCVKNASAGTSTRIVTPHPALQTGPFCFTQVCACDIFICPNP